MELVGQRRNCRCSVRCLVADPLDCLLLHPASVVATLTLEVSVESRAITLLLAPG